MFGSDKKTGFWKDLKRVIEEDGRAILMYVLESTGSSPGRQGFKMFVGPNNYLNGSIGGGIMEHKLVELCRDKIDTPFDPFLKQQIHQSNIKKNKSGMICSGEQHIAFYYLTAKDIPWIETLSKDCKGILTLTQEGISLDVPGKASISFLREESSLLLDVLTFQIKELSETSWNVSEDLDSDPELLIVGGGHVSLALSKIASLLDFKITTFDDRDDLNTVEQNTYSHHVKVDSYENIDNYISAGNNKYVVLMSFGYMTDKVVLRKLINKQFKYLGMMGSKEKVKQLFKELREEGVSDELIAKVHSPIGVQIASKTVEEIAISILAEVIGVKNSI